MDGKQLLWYHLDSPDHSLQQVNSMNLSSAQIYFVVIPLKLMDLKNIFWGILCLYTTARGNNGGEMSNNMQQTL